MTLEYYTTDEAAKLCKVTRGSIIRWIREGKINAAVTFGGHHRILKEDLSNALKTLRLPTPSEQQKTEARQRAPSKTILIVDDEESIRKMLRLFLENHYPDFRIEEAAGGFEAGLKIYRLRPALVLLDLRMPGQDGFSVCKLIRSLPEVASTAIIVITGMQDPATQAAALDLGVNAFLTKPIDIKLLKEKIGKCLGPDGASRGEAA